MIELLLPILDRLTRLSDYRRREARRAFEEVFEPAFGDLLLVHTDYVAMFEHVVSLLPPEGLWFDCGEAFFPQDRVTAESFSQLVQAAKYLRQQRVVFEPVRDRLRVLMTVLGNRRLQPEADQFLEAVISYFPKGAMLGGHTRSRDLLRLLETLTLEWDRNKNNFDQERIARSIARVAEDVLSHLSDIRVRWSQVCEAFAELKLVQSGLRKRKPRLRQPDGSLDSDFWRW